jgi:hypothetical protein
MAMTNEGKYTLAGIAALEGLTYAVLVYLIVTFSTWPDFRPNVGHGELAAIKSTIQSIWLVWFFAWVHKRLQKALTEHGPKPSGWVLTIDVLSSLAPPIGLIAGLMVDWINPPSSGYASWALWYLAFVTALVADALKEDIQALLRHTN